MRQASIFPPLKAKAAVDRYVMRGKESGVHERRQHKKAWREIGEELHRQSFQLMLELPVGK
jgi:hypothetical protein